LIYKVENHTQSMDVAGQRDNKNRMV